MLREDLVDYDVDLLHVERSLSMMCIGSHLYSCYRFVSEPTRLSKCNEVAAKNHYFHVTTIIKRHKD
jgi:hypothetical protein